MNPIHFVELASLGVLACFVALEHQRGNGRASLSLGLALMVAAWLGEDTCIRLYGFYEYSPDWHFTLDKMPPMVALIWPFVILSDLKVMEAVLGKNTPHLPWATGLLVTYDAALMEPIAVQAGLWHWSEPGIFGVPVIGILGWGYFAATALWSWTRLSGAARFSLIALAPLATHALLLVSWWGLLRWCLREPLAPSTLQLGSLLVSLVLSVAVWRARVCIGWETMGLRVLAAGIFGALLVLYGRSATELQLYLLPFVLPYLLACDWSALKRHRTPALPAGND